MICEFGDVSVVPFPFTDIEATKVRPALVISRRSFNAETGSTLVAMITTAKHSTWKSDVAIADLSSAGLRYPSVVRWKIFTLPNELLTRGVGKLAETDRSAVLSTLRTVLP